MKENKFLFEHALHLATGCAILALILFVPATMSKSPGLGIFFYILCALLLVGGGVVLYLAHRERDGRANYFLYDAKKGESLPVTALNAERVRQGVDRYLADYQDDLLSLWEDIPRDLRARLERKEAFRPLVAYRLLLALSECDGADAQVIFAGADDRAVGYLCRAIRDNGDEDMADYIFEMKKNIERDYARVGTFFRKNHRCFEERMLRFVKRHINEFYLDKNPSNKKEA